MFAIAHIRTATLGTQVRWKQLGYMINVFFAGIALGLVYEYVGLLAAILIQYLQQYLQGQYLQQYLQGQCQIVLAKKHFHSGPWRSGVQCWS